MNSDVTVLWPADHSLRPQTLTGASDVDGDPVSVRIMGVTQDEPVNGLGDGSTAPDAVAGADPNQVRLRAERSGTGDGRVYVISYVVSDGQGGTCSGQAGVVVPLSQGSKDVPLDSGQSFDSFGE